jgi:hypothetical protein
MQSIESRRPAARSDVLPFAQRLLFATVIPLMVAYMAANLWVGIVWSSPAVGSAAGNLGPHFGIFFLGALSFVPILITAPFVLFLAVTACKVRWRNRRAAFFGGMLRVIVGIACGGLVVVALKLLS